MKKSVGFFGLIFVAVYLTVSCTPVKKDPEKFGVVKSIKVDRKVDKKTGDVEIVKTAVDEKAERSVADKGADSLMAPQKVVSFGNFFSYYNVASDNSILASVFNNEGEGSDIWLFRNGKIRLTNTTYDHFSPSFSKDGRFVYFASYKGKKTFRKYGQDSYIWRTASTGAGGLTRIGSPSFAYLNASESPSGEEILFTSIELFGNKPYLWYMQNNGSLPTQLKQGHSAQWFDEDTIIFSAEDESTGLETIWTTKLDGSMLTQIISDNNFDCIHPQPSSDGQFVAYVKQDPYVDKKNKKSGVKPDRLKSEVQESRDVYIYNTNDGLSQQITTNESRDDLPKWSEDGKFLHFRSSRGLGWNVWRVNAERLTN